MILKVVLKSTRFGFELCDTKKDKEEKKAPIKSMCWKSFSSFAVVGDFHWSQISVISSYNAVLSVSAHSMEVICTFNV